MFFSFKEDGCARVQIPPSTSGNKKEKLPAEAESFLAAGEGFEPSHTESESAVLPLHNPAVFLTNKSYYTDLKRFVNT